MQSIIKTACWYAFLFYFYYFECFNDCFTRNKNILNEENEISLIPKWIKSKKFIDFSPNALCMSYLFQHFKSQRMAENQKCWKELLITKFTFEIQEERSDMKFRLWFFFYFLLKFEIVLALILISASKYDDNPLDRQEKAWISKQNILRFLFFITTYSLILIKGLWGQTVEDIPFRFPQMASWLLLLSFICIWEVRFKQWLSRFQNLRWMPQSLCLTASILSLFFGSVLFFTNIHYRRIQSWNS